MLTAAYFVALAFLIGAAVYDVTLTERGLRAKLAEEGNTLMTSLFGPTPATVDYYLVEVLIWSLLSVPAIFGFIIPWSPGLFWSMGGYISYGIKHVIGGREWAALLNKEAGK
jgi:hypothetical protein